MHISAHLGLPPGHSHFPFVDVTTRSDTRLFLDPCLIERGQDDFSRYSTALISDFEDKLYWDMRHGRWDSTTVFDEAHGICGMDIGAVPLSLTKRMKSMTPSLDMAQAITGKAKRRTVCGIA